MKTNEDKGLLHGITQIFSGTDRKVKITMAIGLTGMILVLLSTFIPTGTKTSSTKSGEDISSQYLSQTEGKLLSLISSIEGVGKAKVMITLETGKEYVYAKDYKSSSDKNITYEEGQLTKSQENLSGEQKYILLDVDGTGEQALLLTQVEPKIKGVVVVCEGAGNSVVNQRVVMAVTTALGIPSTKVCVIKIAS